MLLRIRAGCPWLCRDRFGTIGKKDSAKLSQTWNLNHRYRVGALRKHKYSILHEGRNNSVVALARGNYDEKELVRLPLLRCGKGFSLYASGRGLVSLNC